MTVREEVKKLLEANRDKSLSGQEIASCLNVTRAAVWKAVNTLKQEGYRIEAVNNRGYRLLEESDVLSSEGIMLQLKENYQNYKIFVHKTIDSTNMEVKRKALEGAEHGTAVLAEEQTCGRGRRGRNFYSPAGTGIYMSVLFRPSREQSGDVVLITTAAAVAICRAIRSVLHEEPEIKWVNDVYLRGKKVCGILTEAVSDFESGQIDTVIVGIGINYRMPENGFPEEISEIAGAVCTETDKVPRNTLVAAVLNELYGLYEGLAERTYMEDYRKWSNVIGREVRFSSNNDWIEAKALDIDENGGLVVALENGERQVLRTGEITLRIKNEE